MTVKEKQTKARISKLVSEIKKEKTLRKKLEKENKLLEKKLEKKSTKKKSTKKKSTKKKSTKKKSTKKKSTKKKSTKKKSTRSRKNPDTDSISLLKTSLRRLKRKVEDNEWVSSIKIIAKNKLLYTWDRTPYIAVRLSNITHYLEDLSYEDDSSKIKNMKKEILIEIDEIQRYIKKNF